MEIRILQMIEGAKQATGLTVIIDVFRAFTVESYIINNGVKELYAVGDMDTAYNLKEKNKDYILVGERHGKILPGFDFGNSPSQIENVDFSNKTVIHTTSAGTQGIVNAKYADEIITGSLVNARAIAEYIIKKQPKTVSLVCMGLEGKAQTDEDNLCAEYIKSIIEGNEFSELQRRIDDLKKTDGAKFFDVKQKEVFPERDFYLSTEVDKFNFVLQVNRVSDDLFQIKRID